MSKSCPTCRRKVELAARYCRACYTVFPSSPRGGGAAAASPARSGAGFKLLLLLPIAVGGWWAWTGESTSSLASRPDAARAPGDGFDATSRDARGGSGTPTKSRSDTASPSDRRATARPAVAPAGSARREFRLAGNVGLLCPDAQGCRILVRFASGESAAFHVRQSGILSASLVPAGPRGAQLLAHSRRATVLAPEGGASVSLVQLASGRWMIV